MRQPRTFIVYWPDITLSVVSARDAEGLYAAIDAAVDAFEPTDAVLLELREGDCYHSVNGRSSLMHPECWWTLVARDGGSLDLPPGSDCETVALPPVYALRRLHRKKAHNVIRTWSAEAGESREQPA